MSRIKYNCKNCGWETSIREEWGDLKPKRCMNKKCNTSFIKNPEALIVTKPEIKVEESKQKNQKKPKHTEVSKAE